MAKGGNSGYGMQDQFSRSIVRGVGVRPSSKSEDLQYLESLMLRFIVAIGANDTAKLKSAAVEFFQKNTQEKAQRENFTFTSADGNNFLHTAIRGHKLTVFSWMLANGFAYLLTQPNAQGVVPQNLAMNSPQFKTVLELHLQKQSGAAPGSQPR